MRGAPYKITNFGAWGVTVFEKSTMKMIRGSMIVRQLWRASPRLPHAVLTDRPCLRQHQLDAPSSRWVGQGLARQSRRTIDPRTISVWNCKNYHSHCPNQNWEFGAVLPQPFIGEGMDNAVQKQGS